MTDDHMTDDHMTDDCMTDDCMSTRDVRNGWACADLSEWGLHAPAESDGECQQTVSWLDYARTAVRGQSYLMWAEYQAAAELFDLVLAQIYDQVTDHPEGVPTDRICDPYSTTAARLAIAVGIHQRTAQVVLDEALASRTRIPRIADLLRDGRLTPDQFRAAVKRTAIVDDPIILATVDERISAILRRAGLGTAKHVERVVDRVLMKHDPEAVRRREAAAAARHNATARNLDEGLGAFTVTASAEDTALALAAINAVIAGVCPHDPRTRAQQRSAAAIAALRGTAFTCGCDDESTCTASLDAQAVSDRQARIVIHVICDSSTLDGDDEPGYLDGHGPISGDHVRDLADRPDTTVRPLDLADITEPVNSPEPEPTDGDPPAPPPGDRREPRPATRDTADELADRRGDDAHPDGLRLGSMALPSAPYRLGTTAEVVIRFLWGTCSVPGCDHPAWQCELDHVEEFDQVTPAAGGPTCLCNVAPKCKYHHTLKTFADGWVDDLYRDATGRYWTETVTPEGSSVAKTAENQWLFPQLDRLRCRHQPVDVDPAEAPAEPALNRTRAKHAWRRSERARLRALRRRAEALDDTGPPPF